VVRTHPDIPGLVDWRPLARGGFSTVWQARQESLNRLVAVKVDHRTLGEDKERRRFLREAGAAGRLSGHAGIVTVHDAGILDDGRPFLVMDLCPGGSLTQWLKPEGRQSQQRIRDIGVRIADALAAAHARGVLHRDVKPANILINAYDQPGLADFGLAALPEPGADLSVTLEGMTPAYAAKEVFYREPPTEFGDVYSLAATLYALLDGKPPRWPDTGTPSLPQLLELQRQRIERLPGVDDEFMDVLLQALDDDPKRRPTAAQFRDQLAALSFPPTSESDLAAAGGAGVVHLDPVGDPHGRSSESAERPGSGSDRRRRRSLTAVLLAATLLAAAVAVGAFLWGPATPAAVPAPGSLPVGSTSAPTPAASTPGAQSSPAEKPSPRGRQRAASRSPVPTPSPEGFVDCSAELGAGSYCVDLDAPECWVNYFQYADLNAAADMTSCKGYHELQTFAAGSLPVVTNRQSQVEARKEVKSLCTRETLNKVLAAGESLKSWQIEVLPAPVDIDTDNLFRCLVGPAQDQSHRLRIAR